MIQKIKVKRLADSDARERFLIHGDWKVWAFDMGDAIIPICGKAIPFLFPGLKSYGWAEFEAVMYIGALPSNVPPGVKRYYIFEDDDDCIVHNCGPAELTDTVGNDFFDDARKYWERMLDQFQTRMLYVGFVRVSS